MELLDRLSQAMAPHEARVLKMFGGTAFKVNENLAIGLTREGVIVRVGPDAMAVALAQPGTRAMEMGGRAMKGWVLVAPETCAGAALDDWVARAMAFNRSLPRAAAKTRKARRKT